MIIAGTAKELVAAVHAAADSSQKATGTVYCVIRMEGGDNDGKYWNGTAWVASASTSTTATHTEAGIWKYTLAAGATSGEAGGNVHYTFTDNLTEASATTVCGGGEHKIWGGEPAEVPARYYK